MMDKKQLSISVVIPNWNGEKLLKKNLPQVLKVLPEGTELIIVDDGSTDGSKEYLKKLVQLHLAKLKNSVAKPPVIKNFTQQISRIKLLDFKVIFNDKNRGFIYSCNRGVKEARGKFVVLLNTDVIPQSGFLQAALRHFKDPKVFAVSFNEGSWGWGRLTWRGGFVQLEDGGQTKGSHFSAWASGGSAVYRRSTWQKLGGFDRLYHPFYWEDIDLGYRAWRAGYKILWEPKARVDHRHEATTAKLSRAYVRRVQARNRLLFLWRYFHGWPWCLSHFFYLSWRLLRHPGYLWVIFLAAWRRYSYRDEGKKFLPPRRSSRTILQLLS